jgi:hypothetical protein
MTFNEAKRLLRDLGYSVSPHVGRIPGVTEYKVHRIWQDPDNGKMRVKRWLLTAEDIKSGVGRAQYIQSEQVQS